MNNENLKPVKELTPFTKMIMTIGTLPSSFYASMSYYESMIWLYEYLKNDVIPTINNNGEAVEELQGKYIELNEYVTGKVEELETYMNKYFDNLDVQQEINNKLDQMALDGTLTNLIKDYVDPIYEAYENTINGEISDFELEISSFKNNINGRLTSMENEIESVTSGSPLVASSTAGMTDTTRVYVNTTDGKWYYYDGDSWEIGGTYQATEDSSTLTEVVNNLEELGYYETTKKLLADLGDITTVTNARLEENGKATATNSWRCTDYINIRNAVVINQYVQNLSGYASICYYDANKYFISFENVTGSSIELIEATIPDNAIYARFSFLASNADQYLEISRSDFQTDRKNIADLQAYDNNLSDIGVYNESKIDITDVIVDQNALIQSNGTIATSNGWRLSQYIPTDDIVSLKFYTLQFNNDVSIAYYNENKVFISGEAGTADNVWNMITADFPDNCKYIRLCWPASASTSYLLVNSSNIELFKNMLLSELTLTPSDLSINGYVDTDGVLQSSSGWRTTDFIPTYDITNIKGIFGEFLQTLFASYYDEYKIFISGQRGRADNVTNNEQGIIPSNAKYVRFSFTASGDTQYVTIYKDNVKTNIMNYNNSLNPLYGKTILMLGDSISAGTSTRPPYAKLIADKNNMNLTNYSTWGATLASNVSGSSSALNEDISDMSSSADYIILSGGINDIYYISQNVENAGEITTGQYGAYQENYDENTLCGALESICTQAISKWSGKKILYVITHRAIDTNVPLENTNLELMRNILKKWSIPFVDLSENCPPLGLPALKDTYTAMGMNPYVDQGDGLHPNIQGYLKFYVPLIEAKLKEL